MSQASWKLIMPSWWRTRSRPCRTWPSSAATPLPCRTSSHTSSRSSQVNEALNYWTKISSESCLVLLTWILIVVVAGSEGKLTVVAQKMSVLSGKRPCRHFELSMSWNCKETFFSLTIFFFVLGIASCSHHAVSGTSSQTLSSAVTVMFIPYLQQEGIVALAFLSLLPARMLEKYTHFREITFISHRKGAFTLMGLEILWKTTVWCFSLVLTFLCVI